MGLFLIISMITGPACQRYGPKWAAVKLNMIPLAAIYSLIARALVLGGRTKSELVQELRTNAVSMNEYAERLFASAHFTTSATRHSVLTVELTVHNLGFPRGATIAEIHGRARELGLGLCPLELGPHLRLQYLDQPEGYWGKPLWKHCAPYGSVTIASKVLTEDDDFPKDFYLRRIKGVLWLRGYSTGPNQVWDGNDHFVFRQV